MTKHLVAALIFPSLLFVACAKISDTGDAGSSQITPTMQQCSVAADCVPEPACHPQQCINKSYRQQLADERNPSGAQQACTELFDCQAAYQASDCLCQENHCVNKNANGGGCNSQI